MKLPPRNTRMLDIHAENATKRRQPCGMTLTSPAGKLCDKCYNDAKPKPMGNEVCRGCKATKSRGGVWVDKKNKAGPLCDKCNKEAKLTGDEKCRECKLTTTSDTWKDKKNKASPLCSKCYAKAGKIRRKAAKAAKAAKAEA